MGLNFWVLMLAIAVLGWNVYTILTVGIANATTLQWVYVGVMVFIVIRRVFVMYLDKKRADS